MRRVAGALILVCATACAGPNEELKTTSADGRGPEPEPDLKVTEFVLGPGDELHVEVFRNQELSRDVKVMPDGTFSYPLLGEVKAAGVGVRELRETITNGLRSHLVVEPVISITITALKSRKVAVLGEVRRPGMFSLEGSLSVIEAVTAAGGFTKEATQRNVLLVRSDRGRAVARTLNISDAINEGALAQNAQLMPGDVLYVPTSLVADVNRFVAHLAQALSAAVLAETGIVLGPQVKDILLGDPIGTTAPPIAITP